MRVGGTKHAYSAQAVSALLDVYKKCLCFELANVGFVEITLLEAIRTSEEQSYTVFSSFSSKSVIIMPSIWLNFPV